FIGSALRHIKSLQYTIKDPPSRSNVAPSLIIEWDGQVVNLKPAEVEQALSEGEPRIELFSGSTGIEILPYMMEVGEDEIVAARLKEILEGAT
ncbi:MAG: selenocysteine synthase, partial [Gemmatimonadetes bacterium]|nr:selenocysteine synthase [Gemmatimonadota bacterium]